MLLTKLRFENGIRWASDGRLLPSNLDLSRLLGLSRDEMPQAKVYNGSCVLGHGILLCDPETIRDIPIRLVIRRGGESVFNGESNTSGMKRSFPELVEFLTREMDFPQGVFLMTGTCLVPDDFTLRPEDVVTVQVGKTKIKNKVSRDEENR